MTDDLSKSAASPAAARLTADKQVREIFETVVVVLILVSLLRIFGAEAFEIPSGSMATTLLGAQKEAACPECGHKSLVNARSQVEGDDDGTGTIERKLVVAGICQNCGKRIDLKSVNPGAGDRVLVAKYWYDGVSEPRRWEIPVFKCPERMNGIKNYIKRLVGLPDETIRIWYGHLLVAKPGTKEFEIARRPPAVMLAVRRLVHDSDEPPKDLRAREVFRWMAQDPAWTSEADGKAWKFSGADSGWLLYQNRIGAGRLGGSNDPSLITDVSSYNSEILQARDIGGGLRESDPEAVFRKANWVRDLMIECRLQVSAAAGNTTLELGAGARRYRLVLDLQNGTATLFQNDRSLASQPCGINTVGEHSVRFADFDERLTVWIDNKLIFGDGVDVEMSKSEEMGPFLSDFEPVKIGASKANIAVRSLKVFRNSYYLQTSREDDARSDRTQDGFLARSSIRSLPASRTEPKEEAVADLRNRLQRAMEFPVELRVDPDSYLMMGDNSPQSFDGRDWTTTHFVPRKMLLGRALSVYWPIWNWKFVR